MIFRRRKAECLVLASGVLVHEGPVARHGIAHPRTDLLCDRYVCQSCGRELFALNADVESMSATGVSGAEMVQRILARVPSPEPALGG